MPQPRVGRYRACLAGGSVSPRLASRPAISEAAAGELQKLGGVLRCLKCGREVRLGDIAEKLRTGWPECHGQTMLWVTSRQLAA